LTESGLRNQRGRESARQPKRELWAPAGYTEPTFLGGFCFMDSGSRTSRERNRARSGFPRSASVHQDGAGGNRVGHRKASTASDARHALGSGFLSRDSLVISVNSGKSGSAPSGRCSL
jgi:hypothetical protein